jgi:hypothetical protein
MGKGSKRKNPGVGVDFRKVKHKVGKKLPKAQNETRTDFQARSINLPNQSITQDKAGAAVSERNLTLKVGRMAVWTLNRQQSQKAEAAVVWWRLDSLELTD